MEEVITIDEQLPFVAKVIGHNNVTIPKDIVKLLDIQLGTLVKVTIKKIVKK